MTELKIPESCAAFSHSLGFLYSHGQVIEILNKANNLLAAKDARIAELENSRSEATAKSIIAALDADKLPAGNSDVEEAIKRRVQRLENIALTLKHESDTNEAYIRTLERKLEESTAYAISEAAKLRERIRELEELVQRYEAAAECPGDDQRHVGASVATQLVHAQHKRDLAEASLAFERVTVAELRMSEHKTREELRQLRERIRELTEAKP